MTFTKTLRRFLLPGFVTTLICAPKFRAFVSPSAEVELSPVLASLFTSAVQAGFVIGTLASAVLGLADRYDPRYVFALSASVGPTPRGGRPEEVGSVERIWK